MTSRPSSADFIYRDPEHAQALRHRLRTLLAEELPAGWLGPFTDDPADLELSNRFCETLASEGLLVPNWPTEFGGQDGDLASSVVIREEMWAHFEPRGAQYYGPNWVGPSIFTYGTPEQKALHLPLIAAGKVRWCQGFSEPEAGSDLANLKTRAVPDGDGFRITGQKTWTSWALWADWCYLLARVDGFGDDRRDGITVFLLPMDREGVSVRGLDGIPGPHHLNDVFFDQVWAERSEVLGELGHGWQVIRDALSKERVGIARYARGDRLLADVGRGARSMSAAAAGRTLQACIRNRMARLMCRRALCFLEDDGAHDFFVCATRMVTTRADLTVADAVSEAAGDAFFEHRYHEGAAFNGAIEFYWRYMQAGTIASGSTEMLQRQLSRAMFRGERIRVSDGAEEVRSLIDRFAADRGRVAIARSAIADPALRGGLLKDFDTLIDSVDPRAGHEEGLLAAEVCRGAGRTVLPLPVESLLLRRSDGIPLAVLSHGGRFEHGDLSTSWHLASLNDEGVVTCEGPDELIASKVGPFVNRAAPTPTGAAEALSETERALLHVLPSWYVLGALEEALDIATRHATERVTFGSPISTYQGVAFPLADACAELQALYELALHALWSAYESPASSRVDALALRWASIDVGRRVLRTAHQVLGAIGFCDEHDLTIVTLSLQGRLRLPFDLDASITALAAAVEESGFSSIFGDGRRS